MARIENVNTALSPSFSVCHKYSSSNKHVLYCRSASQLIESQLMLACFVYKRYKIVPSHSVCFIYWYMLYHNWVDDKEVQQSWCHMEPPVSQRSLNVNVLATLLKRYFVTCDPRAGWLVACFLLQIFFMFAYKYQGYWNGFKTAQGDRTRSPCV